MVRGPTELLLEEFKMAATLDNPQHMTPRPTSSHDRSLTHQTETLVPILHCHCEFMLLT